MVNPIDLVETRGLIFFFNGGNVKMKKRSCAGLILDFILTIMTGGLWLIWILIRYLRNS